MKKLRKTFIFTVITLIMVFALSGCSFIKSNSTGGNFNTGGGSINTTFTAGDSLEAAESVNFNTIIAEDREEMSLIDAVSWVERTSVAITGDSGAGSGVIVDISFNNDKEEYAASWKDDDSIVYIITCQHMVSSTGELTVYVPDENCSYGNKDYTFKGYVGDKPAKEYEDNGYAVTLVGGDFESDIALLKLNLDIAAVSGEKLDETNIEKAKIPNENYHVRKGEMVFSVGNPTGTLPGSVASGVVSYLERETSVQEIGTMRLMQIAVSTNPGNSGGGLYNLYGELIGITNAGNTNYTDINFAIPCTLSNGNGFVEIAAQLGGTAKEDNYGFISGRRIKFGFTSTENEGEEKYVYVASVNSGSIAEKAGLKARDVITSVSVYDLDKNEIYASNISNLQDLDAAIQKLQAGYDIKLNVTRYSSVFSPKPVEGSVTMTCQHYWFCNTGK